jgi:hypothetical protein
MNSKIANSTIQTIIKFHLTDNNLNQAWAVLRCLVSIIYLDIKKSFLKTENMSRPSIYSLEIYSGIKFFFGLTCDLQIGLTVLGEDLVIS